MRVDGGLAGALGRLILGFSEQPRTLPAYGVTIYPATPYAMQSFQDEGDTLASGDMDGDGILDIVVTDCSMGRLAVALGQGDGCFLVNPASIIGSGCSDSVVADFNGNGAPDVALIGGTFNNFMNVYLGNGNGNGNVRTAKNFSTGQSPNQIIAADFDGDARVDLAVTDRDSDDVSIYWGWNSGRLQGPAFYPTGTSPTGLAGADLNGDSVLDLAVVAAGEVSLLMGLGDASFASATSVRWPLSRPDLRQGI